MFSVYTEGVGEVVAKLDNLDARMTEELRRSISTLSIKLQDKVKREKLSGQVLGVRTGRGKRSIQQAVTVDGKRVVGMVSTNVFYMVGWELGWPGAAEHSSLAGAKAKFAVGSSGDNFKNGTPKQRAFLIPSLKEFHESGAIREGIAAGVGRATK